MMKEDTVEPRKTGNRGLRMAYGIFMVCIYLGMAWFFALAPFRAHTLGERVFGGVLFVYGVYRVWRLCRRPKEDKNDDPDNL